MQNTSQLAKLTEQASAIQDQLNRFMQFTREIMAKDSAELGSLTLDPRQANPQTVDLEVYFLFPNLKDSDREALVTLRLTQIGLTMALNTQRSGFSTAENSRLDKAISSMESSFMEIRKGILDSDLAYRLSPFQKEILGSYCVTPFN